MVAETVALGYEVVDLLATLEDALDGLVKGDLGLVKLALNLHDAVGLVGILVLGEIVLELGHGNLLTRGPRGTRVRRQELVHDFRQQLVGH